MRKVLFLFGVLDDRDIDWMIASGRVRDMAAGDILIEQGREIDAVYIVLDGVLAVRVRGNPPREVARLHAGEVVGEMSFVDSRPPSATVTALESARVLAIPRADLRRKLAEPEFAARFYFALSLFLADRLRATTASLGYAKAELPGEEVDSAAEIDSMVLDKVAVAGARFNHMLRELGE